MSEHDYLNTLVHCMDPSSARISEDHDQDGFFIDSAFSLPFRACSLPGQQVSSLAPLATAANQVPLLKSTRLRRKFHRAIFVKNLA
jgi:hypothetical protein